MCRERQYILLLILKLDVLWTILTSPNWIFDYRNVVNFGLKTLRLLVLGSPLKKLAAC